MKVSTIRKFNKSQVLFVAGLIFANLIVRVLVYYNTILFNFGDYSVYLKAVSRISEGEEVRLSAGNFLMTVSYLGYYLKSWFGSLDYFFLFNCLLGTFVTFLGYLLVIRLTGDFLAGILTIILLTIYSEFIVFSSIFYTPIIMIFILSLFLLFLYQYYISVKANRTLLYLSIITLILVISFLFKPELIFVPVFLLIMLVILRKDRIFVKRTFILSLALAAASIGFFSLNVLQIPKGYVTPNDFIFYGHTEFGGDGGEGAFIYQENKEKYDKALEQYLTENDITNPDRRQINQFQKQEIIDFITHHPFKWIKLQITKFFRTFGVVPEASSFKVLYTGLFKDRLWLTAIIVTAPLALIILMFIQLFNIKILKDLLRVKSLFQYSTNPRIQRNKPNIGQKHFMYIYLMLFIYYIVATCFFGHYQERYRLPVMVCFVIPLTAILLANFRLIEYMKRPGIYIRSIITVLFLVIWIFQARTAISNTGRLNNAIEVAKESIETIQ